MSSIMSIGAAGMRMAEARFESAATRIVQAGSGVADSPSTAAFAGDDDLASSLVAMQLASYDFKASAKVVEVGRDLMRTTLDMLA